MMMFITIFAKARENEGPVTKNRILSPCHGKTNAITPFPWSWSFLWWVWDAARDADLSKRESESRSIVLACATESTVLHQCISSQDLQFCSLDHLSASVESGVTRCREAPRRQLTRRGRPCRDCPSTTPSGLYSARVALRWLRRCVLMHTNQWVLKVTCCEWQALKIETGRRYAVKMIDTTNRAFEMSALRKEIDTMQRIDHINCIHLHGVFEEDKYICLVLDLVTGGELFDRIIARGHYSEKDAAEVSREVLLAVAHMHARGIVHRDLKPENLLYISNDENTPEYKHIKVADFGLARHQGPTNPMRTTCGTPGYVAPEVLDPRLWGPSGYGPAIDVWSIGVVLYILLCGFPPFYSENTSTLFRQIRRGDYSFPSPYWDCISDSAKDLVRRMLVVDPSKRLTAEQCLQHRWIVNASLQEDKALGAQHRAFLLIRRLPLFEQVDPSCLAEVTKRLKRVTVKAHEFVIRSGEEGTCMYFVGANPNHTIGSSVYLAEDLARGIQISKCLSVLVDGKEVTQLGTGDYFGEVALMSRSDHKRTADVEARCTCELFALSREDVMEIIKNFPILEARLQSMAEARLKRAQCASKSGSSTSLQNSSFSESDNLYVRSHGAVSHQTVSQQTVPMNIALESPTPQAQQAEQPTPQPKQHWNSLPLGLHFLACS